MTPLAAEVVTSRGWGVRGLWANASRVERLAVLSLLVIPALLYGVPSLLGHPAIDADNLIQNFPLRVLVGEQLRSGHLPLWNPLADSGTPLLGAMNAGAMFPLTWLFAFLPAQLAWFLNLWFVYAASGLGMYALMRWMNVAPWGAWWSAMFYTYAGAMLGQVVHLGVIQGFALLPWWLLLLIAFSRRLQRPSTFGTLAAWALLVGTLWGLIFLTGEPRAIAEFELLTLIAVPAILLLRSSYWMVRWADRAKYVLTLGVGFAFGVALGAVQLLPAWSFIGLSQRSSISYWFFGSGSLPVRWTLLLVAPDLLGGNGGLGQAGYFTNYNLPEVTGYVGLASLAALGAFLFRARWSGWRGPLRDWTIALVLVVIGLLATWGNFTPLGHVFRAIPLFGSTRLQSRNVILVDLGLTMLLGWWLQEIREKRIARGPGAWRRWPGLIFLVGSVGLFVEYVVRQRHFLRWMGVSSVYGLAHHEERLSILTGLVVAILLIVVVAGGRWLLRVSVLSVLLAVDLLIFGLTSATGTIGSGLVTEPSATTAAQQLATTGRTLMIDYMGQPTSVDRSLGYPNTNVFTKVASVQGYGSLISSTYGNETSTHVYGYADPCAVASGRFDQLRLSAVLISSQRLIAPVSATPLHPPSCPIISTTRSLRVFGRPLNVRSLHLQVTGSVNGNPETVTLLGPEGTILATETQVGGADPTFSFSDVRAVGFTLSSVSPLRLVGTQIADGHTVFKTVNGFQSMFQGPSWRIGKTGPDYVIMKKVPSAVRPSLWVAGSSSATLSGVRNAAWGDTWVTVLASHAVTLVRSVAFEPGWRATATSTTGTLRQLPVSADDLIQRVSIPAGTWTVHFHYRAPRIEAGVALSGAAGVLWLGLGGWFYVRARRTTKAKTRV